MFVFDPKNRSSPFIEQEREREQKDAYFCGMDEYTIYVGQIEEWQMINDLMSLDTVFQRAKVMLVGGGTVYLARKTASGEETRFDNFTTLEDLQTYRDNVYKYLKQ